MRVLITGAGGLIGAALTSRLESDGVPVAHLTRQRVLASDPSRIYWHPPSGTLDPAALEGFRTVVHLAGDNIASGKWTPDKKKRIYSSRVTGTTLLCRILANLEQKPKTLICASAIGYYGDGGDEQLTEDSGPGQGFLAEVCTAWEQAAASAVEAGIRVVHLRFGMVLSGRGGALPRMLPVFRLGLGGPLGMGRNWMSWIALEDAVGVMLYAMDARRMKGAVNVVAPNPVQNRDFARALGAALHRPAILPAPAFAIKLLLGEMGRELLLSSSRVTPQRLEQKGFTWRYPDIDEALKACLHGRM